MTTKVITNDNIIFRIIFEKIDTNKDKHVDHEELKKWVESVAQR